MSSGCEILKGKGIKLNGGNGAYGGSMVSCNFRFGTLSSGGHSANVTVEGKKLGTPKIGDSLTLSILGSSFLFDVASYSKSTSATSMTALSLRCVDISHRVLDNVHLILDQENEYTGSNVYKLGKKMVVAPDFVGPYMFPAPTAEYDTPNNIFPNLDPTAVPGKTRYGVKEDKKGGQTLDGIIQGIIEFPSLSNIENMPLDYEGSLRDIITNLSLQVGIIPVYDPHSNSITVLPASGSDDGSSFNLAAGENKLESIGGRCLVVSASEGEDFTTTEAQGAIGKAEFSPSGNSGGPRGGRDKGGKTTRFRRAFLLNPDFHYGACGVIKNKTLPFADKDTGLEARGRPHVRTGQLEAAIGCSYNSKVWALFVLQSVLRAIGNSKHANVPKSEIVVKNQGEQNAVKTIEVELNKTFEAFPTATFPDNPFVADYYLQGQDPCGLGDNPKENMFVRPVALTIPERTKQDGGAVKTTYPDGKIDPLAPSLGPLTNGIVKAVNEWAKKKGDFPYLLTGGFKEGVKNKGKGNESKVAMFENAYMFLHQSGKFSTILNYDGTLDGESDYFRNYLMAVSDFKLKYFVVEGRDMKKTTSFFPDGQGGYNSVDRWKPLPSYNGMMLSTEGSLGASNLQAPDGYEPVPLNPYRPLSTCDTLLGLAKACFWMYVGNRAKEKCIDSFFEERSVGSFVTALRDNTLPQFFAFSKPEDDLQKEEEEKDDEEAGKLWQITLMRATGQDVASEAQAAFNPTETTCAAAEGVGDGAAGETMQVKQDGIAITMTKMIRSVGQDVSFGQEDDPLVGAAFGPAPLEGAQIVDKGKGKKVAEKQTAVELRDAIHGPDDFKGINFMALQNGLGISDPRIVAPIRIRAKEQSGLRTQNIPRYKINAFGEKVAIPNSSEKKFFIRCWYDQEQDPPAVGDGSLGPTNRYVINSYAPIPATWPQVWKTSLKKGFSVNPSDFEFEKHRNEENQARLEAGLPALAYQYDTEGPEYDSTVVSRTKSGLDQLVNQNAWFDDKPSRSKSVTIVVDEETDFGMLPAVMEGLQSLDVSMSGGKTTVSITVGNMNYKKEMQTMRSNNVKAIEHGHKASQLQKERIIDNLKFERLFNIG
tara:strand:- start:4018 stop:7317 length:3300 start_codon:yes stop_codon:yes gene_type:complete